MRMLIVEDDSLMRTVIRSLLDAAGHEVIGETDNAAVATTMIRRFDPDGVVLDLALAGGLGDTVLADVKAARSRCRVVVFSNYASDPAALIKAGATEVVAKPQFDELESILRSWDDGTTAERRQRPTRSLGAAATRSPSGLEEPRDFYTALAASEAGDGLVSFRLADFAIRAKSWGEVISMDWFLLLSRLIRGELRDGDRLACFDGHTVHALIVGGGDAGTRAVIARVDAAWRRERGPEGMPLLTKHVIQDGSTRPDQLLQQVEA